MRLILLNIQKKRKSFNANVLCIAVLRRLPIALVYRSTAAWYLPVLKAAFPSSLIFSALFNGSCGSDAGGLGVVGGDVDSGVSGNDFEPDPEA